MDERILLKWFVEKRCKILKRNTLECRKACFEKVISSWASKNLDTVLIGLVTVSF